MNESHPALFAHAPSRRLLALVTALCFLAGCGTGPRLGQVEGRVTKDGAPQENLWVQFSPTGARPSHARTDSDGRFVIRYKDREGAVVGTHKVKIGSGGEVDERGNPLNPTVVLVETEVSVQPGDNSFDFELNDYEGER